MELIRVCVCVSKCFVDDGDDNPTLYFPSYNTK